MGYSRDISWLSKELEMEREDFFPGISVFIFILLIINKFIKQAFAICISETRKLARRLSPPEIVH